MDRRPFEAIAAKRGITPEDAQMLALKQAITADELCTMSDDILRPSIRKATTPKNGSPGSMSPEVLGG